MLHTTLGIDKTSRHLGRVEARSDGVGENVPGAQLNSQVLGQMNSSGLGGRVARRGILANRTDTDTSNGSGDDDSRGLVDGGLDGEKGRKSGNG
jgi:hypothetical protein